MVVAVGDPSEQLVEEALEDVGLQPSLTNVEVLLQVLVQVLEHQGQLPLRVHHVVQAGVGEAAPAATSKLLLRGRWSLSASSYRHPFEEGVCGN